MTSIMRVGSGQKGGSMSCIRLLVFAVFASVGAMWAQSTRGVIVGAVTDQSGSAVPGAEVTVSNEKTNIATKTLTSSDGQYAVTNLERSEERRVGKECRS